MKTFTERLKELWEEARIVIINKVKEHGTESDFIFSKTIKVDDENSFTLEDDKYLSEISEGLLLDQNGMGYAYGILSYTQLCDIADSLNKVD